MNYLFILFIALTGCDTTNKTVKTPQNKTIEIPLFTNRGRPVLEVMVEGKGPYKFFLDTGASTNVLDITVGKEVGLSVKENITLSSPAGKGIPAVDYGKVNYTIGGVSFANTNLTNRGMDRLSQSSGLAGVISYRLFQDYTMTFDFKNRKLLLSKKIIDKNDDNVMAYNHAENGAIISLPSKLGDTTINLDMDTGSPSIITLPVGLSDKMNFENEPLEQGKIRLIDTEMIIYTAKLKDNIKIGTFTLEKPEVRLTDFKGHGNLGMGFLMQYNVSIDQKNKLIKLVPNGMKLPTTQPRIRTRKQPTPEKAKSIDSSNPYVGTYEGDRKIWLDGKNLKYQREQAAILVLKKQSEDTYQLSIPNRNIPLPSVKFNRDNSDNVISIEFIDKSGKAEGIFKKEK